MNCLRLIVITTENFFEGETNTLNLLFDNGLELVHLRKPKASETEMVHFIEQIHQKYHSRIVLHDHFSLANRFHLKGIHLNARNRNIPENFQGTVSRSCHILNELEQFSDLDYLFLSPIFDSISKEGYTLRFSESLLYDFKSKDVINEKIIALGGINKDNIYKVKDYGFGGVAVLGALWGDFPEKQDFNELLTRFKELQHAVGQ
jgi:thiamine-phosphate pyrophosphorylase